MVQSIWGNTVGNDEDSRGQDLEESARQHNSNLQHLIEAVGGLLAGSGELLARLQRILSRGEPSNVDSHERQSDEPEAADYRKDETGSVC